MKMHGYRDTHYLAGGGVIGLRSTANSATIDSITGNVFQNVGVAADKDPNGTDSAYIEGGGVIGVDAVSSPSAPVGTASIAKLTNNLFTGASVKTGDIILGGGIVGLNNNSQSEKSRVFLGEVSGNIFGNGSDGNISVSAGYSLRGGGVGLQTNSDTLLALGEDHKPIEEDENTDDGTYIPSATPDAGVSATLGSVSRNLFLNTKVSAGTFIDGGGIIGVRSNVGIASLLHLNGNIFKGLTVETKGGDITGGGIVGVSAANWAGLSEVTSNDFDGIGVTATGGGITGGGVIGVSAAKYSSQSDFTATVIGNVQNNTFNNVKIKADNLIGGGFIGAVTSEDFAGMNEISGSTLGTQNSVVISDDLTGGGFAGAVATAQTRGNAFINSVNENKISNLTVNVDGDITGGGVIGVVGEEFSRIGQISGNTFELLMITAGGHIDGGGIIGATSKSSGGTGSRYAGIELIDNSKFYGNTVTAGTGRIMGGLVYSYGLSGGMTIKDSAFYGNMFQAKTVDDVYGTVTVDTGTKNAAGDPHTLTLTATAGKETRFDGNAIYDSTWNDVRFNSLYVGGVWNKTDTNNNSNPPEADAALVIDAQKNGDVYLYDPIKVNQTDSGNGTYGFNMTVKGSGGRFSWGGGNIFDVDNPSADYKSITLENGSKTWLLGGYRPLLASDTDEERVIFTLNAPNFDFNLNSGAWMEIGGSNEMTLTNAKLAGTLNFDLEGTRWVDQSGSSNFLLTVNNTGGGKTDISGSLISLTDLTSNNPITKGAKVFPLIATASPGDLIGKPVNSIASAKKGYLESYDFIVDTLGPDNDTSSTNLYAYLHPDTPTIPGTDIPAPKPSPHSRTLVEGRAAGLGFLRATWLPDHSYQQADLALYQEGTYKSWVPFAGIDGSWARVDTGSDGRYDVTGVNGLLGIARENKKPGESLLTGLFVDAGYGDYDTFNTIHHAPHDIDLRGDGKLRFVGGGIMARREWSNGVRLEGSFRAGQIKNEFRSGDFIDEETQIEASYDSSTPYYAVHVGLARAWMLNERRRLDVIGRYFWTRQDGEAAILPNGEIIHFDTDDSQRVRLGGRLTFMKDERREWYLGAAGEYEFGGDVNASTVHGYAVDTSSLHGFTGIGELGLIRRSTKDNDFSFETGLQGYIGRMRGVTGGIRMEWRF